MCHIMESSSFELDAFGPALPLAVQPERMHQQLDLQQLPVMRYPSVGVPDSPYQCPSSQSPQLFQQPSDADRLDFLEPLSRTTRQLPVPASRSLADATHDWAQASAWNPGCLDMCSSPMVQGISHGGLDANRDSSALSRKRPQALALEVDSEESDGWSDDGMDLEGLASSLGGLGMAAAAPSRVMVRVRINDRTELGVRVNMMQEDWTLRELMQQVEHDSKVALYCGRGAQLHAVRHGSKGEQLLYQPGVMDTRHKTLGELNIGSHCIQPCLSVYYKDNTRSRKTRPSPLSKLRHEARSQPWQTNAVKKKAISKCTRKHKTHSVMDRCIVSNNVYSPYHD